MHHSLLAHNFASRRFRLPQKQPLSLSTNYLVQRLQYRKQESEGYRAMLFYELAGADEELPSIDRRTLGTPMASQLSVQDDLSNSSGSAAGAEQGVR